MTIDQPLPHDEDLERCVIAACIMEPSVIDVVQPTLPTGQWFFEPRLGIVYDALLTMRTKNVAIDLVSLAAYLRQAQQLATIGGMSELARITSAVSTSVNAESHAKSVAEMTMKRGVLQMFAVMQPRVYEADVATVMEEVQAQLNVIQGSTSALQNDKDSSTLIRDVTNFVQDAQNAKGSTDFVVPYCIPAIDRHIKQLRGQMHILAALSGIGKTALGLSCMDKQIEAGMNIVYICGESSAQEILTRLSCINSQLSFMKLVSGNLSSAEFTSFRKSMERLRKLRDNFIIVGKGDIIYRMDAIKRQLHKAQTQMGRIDMVYIDYLQNMQPMLGTEKDARFAQVEKNVMGVNALFGEFNVAGVVMSQINRDGAHAGRPGMSHLKYSSTIENEAHLITFLHREEMGEGTLPTQWYSGKGRLLGNFATELMFRGSNAQYYGKAHRYDKEDRPDPSPAYGAGHELPSEQIGDKISA